MWGSNDEIIQSYKELSIESKSVVLIEHLDKIANLCLSEISIVQDSETSEEVLKKKSNKPKRNSLKCIVQESLALAIKSENKNEGASNFVKELFITSKSTKIARKYFQIWKMKVKKKRPDTAIVKKEKIDKFVERLKECKERIKRAEQKDIQKNKAINCYRPEIRNQDIEKQYNNRYKSQQNIIENQKIKLKEQQSIIENLRLGIIQEETEKSMENSRNQIREIFRKCSGRVRCKITPPEACENDVNLIELKSTKPPRIVVEMEKRAEDRAIKRQIILERKKILDERKQKEITEAVERKKATDEEQRQKNLDAIKEKRRKEAEATRMKDLQKQHYLASIRKTIKFYNKRIKLKTFEAWRKLMELKEENVNKSECFYTILLQKRHFQFWRKYTIVKIEARNYKSESFYNELLLTKLFKHWRQFLHTRKQDMQVAEDLFDMQLQSRIFIRWRTILIKNNLLQEKKLQTAAKHYNRRIVLQYFYLWKSLPAVLKLEKAKEEKKRRWREKVWEIIPDYQPYTEDSKITIKT